MITSEYKIIDNKPIIYSFNGDGSYDVIDNFTPYLYCRTIDKHKFDLCHLVTKTENTNFINLNGDKVSKVYYNNPNDWHYLKKIAPTYEADLDLNTRFSIDYFREHKKEDYPILYLDIETDHDNRFPKPELALFPITAITVFNSKTNTMITFVWREDLTNHNKTTNVRSYINGDREISYNDITITYNSEHTMLHNFIQYLKDSKFMVASAWNNYFDFPYIINRMFKIGIDYNELSPIGKVDIENTKDNKQVIKVAGKVLFDLLIGYKKVHFKGLESFKLDNVAELELGEKKLKYMGTIAHLWRNDIQTLIDYNKKDVELLFRIDRKQKIIERFDEVRRMSKCRFDDIFLSTKVIDSFVISYSIKKGLVLPTKIRHDKEEFAGAIVLQPKQGLHSFVSVLDAASMYPSIIRSINCSPDTIRTKSENNICIKIAYLNFNLLSKEISNKSKIQRINDEFIDFFINNWNILEQKFSKELPNRFKKYVNIKTVYFDKSSKGLLPEIMEYLSDFRGMAKKERDKYDFGSEEYEFYEGKQYAIKILNNCFHPNTKIMTKNGIKNIKDVKIGDIVYSINPKTLKMEYKPVTALCEEPFDGELCVYENQSFKLRTTPNHKYLIKDRDNKIKKVSADELKTNQVIPIHKKIDFSHQEYLYLYDLLEFKNPKLYVRYNRDLRILKRELKENDINLILKKSNKHYLGKDTHMTEVIEWTKKDIKNAEKLGYEFYWKDGYSASIILPYKIKNYDFSKIVGWYVSEGHLYKNKPKQFSTAYRGVSYTIHIAQELYQEELVNDIKKLIHRFYRNKKGISLCSKVLFKFFEQFDKGSFNIYIPQKYMDLLDNQGLFDGLFMGDGRKSDNTYCTASPRLAENFLHLAYRLGYKGHSKKRKNENCYDVKFFNKKSDWGVRKKYLSKEYYKGNVYNLTVDDNHTVLVGEKHGFIWCGQSFYGSISYYGFRLYKPEIGASITNIGRNLILWSKRLIENMNYDVILSDSDSLGFQSGNSDNYIDNSFEMTKKLNSTYNDFFKIFNVDNHYLRMEFEKTFKTLLVGNAKKRYAGNICYYKGKEVNDLLIMGFETVRSDVSKITRELQRNLFTMLLLENKTKQEVLDYVREIIDSIKKSKIDYNDIGIPTNYSKPLNEYTSELPITRAIKFCNSVLDMDIQVGEKIKLLYIKSCGRYSTTDVIGFRDSYDIPKDVKVNIDRHIQDSVYDKIDRIFTILGWDVNELKYKGSLI